MVRAANGPQCGGLANALRQLLVGNYVAVGNFLKGLPNPFLKGRAAGIQGEGERSTLAREVLENLLSRCGEECFAVVEGGFLVLCWVLLWLGWFLTWRFLRDGVRTLPVDVRQKTSLSDDLECSDWRVDYLAWHGFFDGAGTTSDEPVRPAVNGWYDRRRMAGTTGGEWPVRPAANARYRAKSTSAGHVADPPVNRKGPPLARFSSSGVLNGHRPSRFRAGLPAPAVGHSGANSGHGPPFATLRPPLSRAALESNRLPGGSHIGPEGLSAMESLAALPRGLTAPLADVPGVYRLKTKFVGASWRGRDPAGRPLGGLTGYPPDAPELGALAKGWSVSATHPNSGKPAVFLVTGFHGPVVVLLGGSMESEALRKFSPSKATQKAKTPLTISGQGRVMKKTIGFQEGRLLGCVSLSGKTQFPMSPGTTFPARCRWSMSILMTSMRSSLRTVYGTGQPLRITSV